MNRRGFKVAIGIINCLMMDSTDKRQCEMITFFTDVSLPY
jgi:hypothetical protein